MAKSSTKSINYDELNTELSELLSRLEGGELAIDDAVKSYERGIEVVKILENHLRSAENRVRELRDSLDPDLSPKAE